MSTASSPNRSIEIGLLLLIFLGALFEAAGLYVDYTDPNFYLALDLEVAGLALILFGFIGDVLYSHVSN